MTISVTPESASYMPSWSTGGCVAKASDLLASPWRYSVSDSDVLSDDSITGNLTHQVTEANFAAGSVTLPASGGMQSMTVQLVKQ
jgi:hypothetical protein